jgi:Homeodomain-like domain
MARYRVTLTAEERRDLEEMRRKGTHKSQKVLNGLILLNCDEGTHQKARQDNATVAHVLQISERKINRVKQRFVEDGLEVALNGRSRQRAYEKKADGDFEAHIVALSCGDPPEGFARWSLRLLAEKAVELQYVESVSHETVRRVLKKTRSSRGVKRAG